MLSFIRGLTTRQLHDGVCALLAVLRIPDVMTMVMDDVGEGGVNDVIGDVMMFMILVLAMAMIMMAMLVTMVESGCALICGTCVNSMNVT